MIMGAGLKGVGVGCAVKHVGMWPARAACVHGARKCEIPRGGVGCQQHVVQVACDLVVLTHGDPCGPANMHNAQARLAVANHEPTCDVNVAARAGVEQRRRLRGHGAGRSGTWTR